jgi:hypothetical protein
MTSCAKVYPLGDGVVTADQAGVCAAVAVDVWECRLLALSQSMA